MTNLFGQDGEKQFTVETIERTLHHFYNDVQSQAQANEYLILAQISRSAWTFSWELLHPSKPAETQFFGASALQVKITKYWKELSYDEYGPLRDKLLEALCNYITGPKVILTRICIATASFIIQTINDFWPTAINDIINAFRPQNIPNASPAQVVYALIELLTVLSEEFQTTHMPTQKQNIVRVALQSSFKVVMELVYDVISKNTAPVELCEISLKCFSSWVQLGNSIMEFESLLLLAFDLVYREEVSQTALETLSNIANYPDNYKYPTVILKMVEQAVKFESLLQKAQQDDDMEKCGSIYSVIIAIAESHCHLLLDRILQKPQEKDMILKLFELILKCSSTPGHFPVDELCSEQAFGFWYALQDAITSSEPRKFEALLLIFHSIFQSLMDAYLVKLQYPPEHSYRHWKADEQESFRCYRQDIGDSLMYCYNILREASLANLMAHLSIATTAAINSPSQWQYLDACLFAFKEMAVGIESHENFFIPQFLSQLQNIPLQHMNLKIVTDTMEAIGAYAEWINDHPAILESIIPLLLMGIQNGEVAPSATFALKDITRDCRSALHPFAEQILYTSREALHRNVFKSREKVRIMCTIGKVLSIMPHSFIMSYLETVLSQVFSELQQHLVEKSNPNSCQVVVINLHMLTMLFSSLDTKWDKDDEKSKQDCAQDSELAPVLLVLQKLLSVFSSLGNNWTVNEPITEALSDALKRAVVTLSEQCKVLLPDILNLTLYLYKQCPHSSVLDLSKQLFLIFVDDEDMRPQLTAFFKEICDHTVELCMKDFRENTSVVEMFLELLEYVIKKAFVFFKSEAINPAILFHFGVAALTLQERPTVKAAAGFLAEFIMHSRGVPNMLNVVFAHGDSLVMQVLKVIGSTESPRCVVEYMPDILTALNKKYFDNLCRWMVPFTQQNDFPSSKVNQQEKEKFTRQVLKERANKRKLKETVTEFGLLCRGIIGAE